MKMNTETELTKFSRMTIKKIPHEIMRLRLGRRRFCGDLRYKIIEIPKRVLLPTTSIV